MLIFRMIMECKTPLHCGGGKDDLLDQPVSRDAFGFWRIPGSSLAGALRSLASEMDEKMANELFGFQEKENSHASLIWCEDGRLLDYDGKLALAKHIAGNAVKIDCAAPYVRDHVRLTLAHGTAEDGGKFDMEFVPAGARFLLEFRCDGWNSALSDAQKDFFARLCARVLEGDLLAGGKSGLGYGQYAAPEFQFAEFDLQSVEGMEAWLNLAPEGAFPKGAREWPLQKAANGGKAAAGLDGWLEIPLVFNGPVLVGGGAAGKNAASSEADMLFALTPALHYGQNGEGCVAYEAALPASAIRGLARHAIYGILRDRGAGAEKAEDILSGIFGRVEKGGEGQCGKLIFMDAALVSGTDKDDPMPLLLCQHVAVDRFSGATMTGALFSEEPYWKRGAGTVLKIRACNLEAFESALLFQALLDLCAGELPIGGGVNRGNGRPLLEGWHENPQKALSALAGNMAWNGESLFAGGDILGQLRKFSPEWDGDLKERI